MHVNDMAEYIGAAIDPRSVVHAILGERSLNVKITDLVTGFLHQGVGWSLCSYVPFYEFLENFNWVTSAVDCMTCVVRLARRES